MIRIYSIILLLFITSSCKKFAEIPLPPDRLPAESTFSDDNTAIKAITGIYSQMMENSQQFSDGYTTLFAGLSADELYYYTPGFQDEFSANQITLSSQSLVEFWFWNPAYKYIYAANKCIESAAGSHGLSPAAQEMITGEAKFIRAFCYFYLVNLFGDVPLITSSDYQDSQLQPRTDRDSVYQQMINDLIDAQGDLPDEYPSPERVRPNKAAATALLARICLYTGRWTDAEVASTAVISSGNYTLESDLAAVFRINSNETIWQLMPVDPTKNTYEAYYIIPADSTATPTYLVTPGLLASFEPGDLRRMNWVGSRQFAGDSLYYPLKYKLPTGPPLDEYYVVLRLAEQYLVRAEARAQLNDLTGSAEDLNSIRNRAGLPNTTATDQASLLAAIEQERRIELFSEWGHRWFDLKRTGRVSTVLQPLKPSTWQATDSLWPIPQNQLKLNPALTQNAGY